MLPRGNSISLSENTSLTVTLSKLITTVRGSGWLFHPAISPSG
jgi:hypothetical protein